MNIIFEFYHKKLIRATFAQHSRKEFKLIIFLRESFGIKKSKQTKFKSFCNFAQLVIIRIIFAKTIFKIIFIV